MLGGKDLEQLGLQKQALLVESSLNRHALLSELDALRASAERLSQAFLAPRRLVPLLMGLAPLAGFFAVRGVRKPISMISRAAKLVKWVGPAFALWRSLSAARRRAAEGE